MAKETLIKEGKKPKRSGGEKKNRPYKKLAMRKATIQQGVLQKVRQEDRWRGRETDGAKKSDDVKLSPNRMDLKERRC